MLTRTDPDAPKHKGITFLLVPMDQPGVEVRPIRMMTGASEFNETFFTDARTPRDNVVGAVNAGWAVAMTLLGYERGEAAATLPIMFRAELDRLVSLARETGRAADPLIRQRLAWRYAKVEIMRYLGMRTLTKFLAGAEPGPAAVDLQAVLERVPQGSDGAGRGHPGRRRLDPVRASLQRVPGRRRRVRPTTAPPGSSTFLSSRAETIYAGTSQVQRNIIGEMVLGLPKEPAPTGTTGKSWREIQQAIGG